MKHMMSNVTLLAMGFVLAASGGAAAQQAEQGRVHTEHFFPTGQRTTSILLIERMAPAEARAGTDIEYQVRITNLTDAALGGVTVIETFPEGFTIESVEPSPRDRGARSAEWQLETLAGGESVTIRISGSAERAGELTGCVEVRLTTENCSTLWVVEPRLSLEKSMPSQVSFCDSIPMRLVVTNTGTGTARDVQIEDSLPDGLTTAAGDRTVRFDVGDLAEGASREFTVDLRATQTGSFSNRATATAEGDLTAEARAETRVIKPELVVEKTGPEMRYVGRPANMRITVRNTGDEAARETVLVDTMPEGVRVLEVSDNGRIDGSRVTWNLGTLEPGASREVTVTVTSDRIGYMENTASASAICADGQASARVEFRGIHAILLEMRDDPDPIEVGQTTTYEIVVTNQGSTAGTNIVINCTVPDEQEYVSAEGPTEVSVDARRITFAPLPSLAPKARAIYRVTTRGIAEGDTRFRVELTSDQLTAPPVMATESTHVY